jgi:cytochrome oxidase Cu insertion factor (SCO1/SenC/PrrC family)
VAWAALALAAVFAAIVATGTPLFSDSSSSPASRQALALATNPALDPGTRLSGGPAPEFTLIDQYGQPVSLRSFRGRAVILAFNDARCTNVCPLTTTAMVKAKALLGPAGSQVALLGVDANPSATRVADVRAYSQVHGMLHAWHFLTGALPQVERVWRAYHVAVQIEQGQIDHTPAVFVIDPRGGLAKLYTIQMAYTGIDQQAQILANEVAGLLPGHPAVQAARSYAPIPPVTPRIAVALPRAGGGIGA